MQITSNNKTEANTVEIEFNVNGEDFEKALEAAFLKKRKNISIPGFRKGKASRKMIEKTYGEATFYEDAINDLYRFHITAVIDEAGVTLVDAPDIEVKDISRENGVTYKLKLTVKPEITVGEYKGVEVEVEVSDVSEEDIDKELEKIVAENARIIDVSDRPVENGDMIRFDFEGFCEGEPFDGGRAEDFELEVGSKRFIPGFEEQVIGHSAHEDFEIDVTFPEEYPAENVRGKDVTFKCRIHEISAQEKAVLDDEFVKDISEFDTIAEYRESLREKLAENFAEIRDVELENAVAAKVAESVEGEIPPTMFEQRIDEMAQDWSSKYGMSPEVFARSTGSNLASYREGFREIAEKQVTFRLALEKIAEIEDFEVSDEEYEAEINKMAEQNRMTLEKVNEIVTRELVEADIKTGKALALIKESAVVIEVARKKEKEEDEGGHQ
jgi:trigger factor